ncbi:flagellar hook-associated protein FlgK [Aquibium sp. A9E412]|uniref:flagellar hook-associated protein FlgK n=1 Tax=Aquibium sp. A9E412 TaxID=2976767 RepID=UPI0025AFF843|nr:flagellar hook-associated protein FlgK [Aquibium sp. A9E412]MDN2567253.1 flagellar hook-associated protein FlgK [Aquibium sp. A9E412]
MSLTSALSIAQSALLNTGRQTGVVSRNVQEAANPDYARREAVTTTSGSGARVTEIRRATDAVLFRHNLAALSAQSGQATVSKGLDTLRLSVNGADNGASAAAAIGDLIKALEFYAATPSNPTLASTTVEAARNAVRALHDGSTAIQTFRSDADREIAAAVDDLNRLLGDFETVNREVVAGTRTGRDVSDALDQRDALLKQISAHVSISTVSRPGNDIMIVTGDGATLFETVPREVSFQPLATHVPGTPGNAVTIDGVPLKPGSGGSTSASGTIAAKLQLRDTVAVTMQRQLDEVARGLITAFAETAPGGGAPDRAGLFTWPGGPALPPAGTAIDGLAAAIRVNPAMDPAAGGDPQLLRDGGANGPAYLANATGGASFSDLLRRYADGLDRPIAVDPAAGLDDSRSVVALSSDAVGWLEALRQDAATGSERKDALAQRMGTALSNATGVNVDEEMALLLELEHSYEASARLMRVIDEMLATLLAATG